MKYWHTLSDCNKDEELTGVRSVWHFNLDGPICQETLGGVAFHCLSLSDQITVLDRKHHETAEWSNKTKPMNTTSLQDWLQKKIEETLQIPFATVSESIHPSISTILHSARSLSHMWNRCFESLVSGVKGDLPFLPSVQSEGEWRWSSLKRVLVVCPDLL